MLLTASTAVGSAGGFSLLSAGSFVPSVLGGSTSEGLSWELQPVPPGLVWAQCGPLATAPTPCSCRSDVCQKDDGEDGGSKDPPGAEEDDL